MIVSCKAKKKWAVCELKFVIALKLYIIIIPFTEMIFYRYIFSQLYDWLCHLTTLLYYLALFVKVAK